MADFLPYQKDFFKMHSYRSFSSLDCLPQYQEIIPRSIIPLMIHPTNRFQVREVFIMECMLKKSFYYGRFSAILEGRLQNAFVQVLQFLGLSAIIPRHNTKEYNTLDDTSHKPVSGERSFYHGMHVEEVLLLWQIFCHIRRTSSKCIRIGPLVPWTVCHSTKK